MPKGHIYILGQIAPHDPNETGRTSISLRDVEAQVKALGKFNELDVHIRSEGGNVAEGYAIREYIQSLGVKTNTIIEGLCASIATIVQQANANGGTRKMWNSSEFFIHNPWVREVSGDASTLAEYAQSLKAEEEKMAAFYSERSKADVAVIAEYMAEQKTFTPDEALALGFIDEIVDNTTKALAIMPTKEKSIETIIKNEMANLKDVMQKALLALGGKKEPVAMVVKLTDGTEVFVEGEVAEGSTVYIGTDATGEKAPDGSHMLESGVTVVTQDGVITAIEEMVDVAALKAEIDALKAELAAKETTEAEAVQVIEDLTAETVALKSKLGSGYTPAPRQKQVLAKKQEPGERNRIEEAKERKATYKKHSPLIK